VIALAMAPHVSLSAKVQKDGSITVTGTTTVAGKVSASGVVGGKGTVAANKHGRKRHKTPAAAFGPASETLTGAGSFTLKLKPNSTALAQLRGGKSLKVTITVALLPADHAKSVTAKTTFTDRLSHKKHH
jgi:hypothetical protein